MKKNKKGKLTKKEKIILIALAIVAFILILGIALMPTRNKSTKIEKDMQDINRELTSVLIWLI